MALSNSRLFMKPLPRSRTRSASSLFTCGGRGNEREGGGRELEGEIKQNLVHVERKGIGGRGADVM